MVIANIFGVAIKFLDIKWTDGLTPIIRQPQVPHEIVFLMILRRCY